MRKVSQANLNLFEHDADEVIIGEIPRHPIGYIFIFVVTLLIFSLIMIGMYLAILNRESLASTLSVDNLSSFDNLITLITSSIMIFVAFGALLAAYVYQGNYIVLTDQKLVLVNRRSIIARRVSQLSIGDVQDVTIDQITLLSRIFKYGTINIETAGEQAHFTFQFAHHPHECGKSIINAHEENLKKYGN